MYKNEAVTWTDNPELDQLYEQLRDQHHKRVNLRLHENYSPEHVKEVSAKTIYFGPTGEPEIVCSILQRPCWPTNTYRILNRLWKPNIFTYPVFGISEGFVKIIQSQVAWCSGRGAKAFFMSREGDNNWQRWTGDKLSKLTGINFLQPEKKFLTCGNDQDESCWQHILFYGETAVFSDWKNREKNVKNGLYRLDESDVPALNELVNAKAVVKGLIVDDLKNALTYRVKWLEGMKRWYLDPKSITHYMYGWYKDGKLISCMTWRCDLPEPWNDGWVVGNLKSVPGNTVKTNGMLEIWNKMFEICESLGLKRWHMVIPESNSHRYQVVADRYFRDIDSSYDYEWSIVVPPNTKPEVEWVWGTMGRMLLNNEIRVRTGTKKPEFQKNN